MNNPKIIFTSSKLSEHTSELECYRNLKNEIYIEIKYNGENQYICLDRNAAIKLSKTLKTEISKIEEVYIVR